MSKRVRKSAKKVAVKITIEVVDRYSATGRPRPDPKTVCKGPCEGMGVFPYAPRGIRRGRNLLYLTLWEKAERKKMSGDGWHLLKCPDCNGTGKRKGAK